VTRCSAPQGETLLTLPTSTAETLVCGNTVAVTLTSQVPWGTVMLWNVVSAGGSGR
jgi:hypothetical protein